jgi:hypothetical protein
MPKRHPKAKDIAEMAKAITKSKVPTDSVNFIASILHLASKKRKSAA